MIRATADGRRVEVPDIALTEIVLSLVKIIPDNKIEGGGGHRGGNQLVVTSASGTVSSICPSAADEVAPGTSSAAVS